ncbi:hypothetical protein BV22DRAFT_1134685 [Leucogyrophana mollusca]|uniref:Uncharacterized protein n=1 Tax=Leucogyrophana mollusca TaxID=85980 RepID=A0ACB8AY50_9AGAM|nr:hypothetical protein BV22DRAFT_1134685 [Leucogyrophana mollusca]
MSHHLAPSRTFLRPVGTSHALSGPTTPSHTLPRPPVPSCTLSAPPSRSCTLPHLPAPSRALSRPLAASCALSAPQHLLAPFCALLHRPVPSPTSCVLFAPPSPAFLRPLAPHYPLLHGPALSHAFLRPLVCNLPRYHRSPAYAARYAPPPHSPGIIQVALVD